MRRCYEMVLQDGATVPVNKKFTFHFKKTIVLRLTILSKTVLLRKGNATVTPSGNEMEQPKKTERNVLRTVHAKCKKTSVKQFSS